MILRVFAALLATVAVTGCSTAPDASGGAAMPGTASASTQRTPSSPSAAATSTEPSQGIALDAYSGIDGLAVDSAGVVYVSQCVQHTVFRLDPDGSAAVYAGVGVEGFSGDGGPATEAELNCPAGLALDTEGRLYITDHWNNRIRRVDPSGMISTVAGGGETGFNRGGFSGDGGSASEAALNEPAGIAVDAGGNLYIADRDNYRIRKVDQGGTITTIAGVGTAGADGDGGPAVEAELGTIHNVAVGADGSLYIADLSLHRVRRVDSGGVISTVAGTGSPGYSGDDGPASEAQLAGPDGLAVHPNGDVYIADSGNDRIRRFDANGAMVTIAGSGSAGTPVAGVPATAVELTNPTTLAFGPGGDLYFVDNGSSVRAIGRDGAIRAILGPQE